MYHVGSTGWIDKPIVEGESNLADLTPWFQLVEGLCPTFHQRFILAARLYHQALELIEDTPDIAYLNLVSAIETLAGDFDIGSPTLVEYDEDLARLVGLIEDVSLREQVTNRILHRQRFHKRRFVDFVIHHIKSEFWVQDRPDSFKVDQDDLPRLLRRIYDKRSSALHAGEPFPAAIHSSPWVPGAEIVMTEKLTAGDRYWTQADQVPYPHFFERLVRHVLRTYLERNQAGL